MLDTRLVTETFLLEDGTPWEDALVIVRLLTGTYADGVTYPAQELRIRTDENGFFTTELVVLEHGELQAYYEIELPDGVTFQFALLDGGDTTISELRTFAILPGDPTYPILSAYIDTHLGGFPFSGVPADGDVPVYAAGAVTWEPQSGGGASDFADLTGVIAAGQVPVGVVTQHAAALAIGWAQLTGVPGTFPPEAHTHDANAGLTGTVLAATVVTSSLTAIGTLVAGSVPAARVATGTFGAGDYVFPATLTSVSQIATGTGVVGHTVALAIGNPNTAGGLTTPTLGVFSTSVTPLGLGRWNTASGGGVALTFARSAAAAIGTFAPLAAGWRLATIGVMGDDGTDLATQAGYLRWEVDGAVATNRVPGRLLIALAAGTSDDDVTERARFTVTGLSLGTQTAPTAAGSLAAIGTGRFGAAVISTGAHLEANFATGTATIVPVTLRIRSLSNGNDWASGPGNPFANIDFHSDDGGVTAAPVRGRIGVYMSVVQGTTSGMVFLVGASGSTLVQALDLSAAGLATFAGTIFAPAATAALASVVIPHGAAAPTGGALVNGAFWTTTSALFGRINGTTLTYLGTAGIGAAGTFLRSTGTAGAWSTATIPATVAIGDILYGSAANVWTALTGAAGVLVGAAGAAPAWANTITLTGQIIGAGLRSSADPTATAGQTGIGVTTGLGDGIATAMLAPLKGTGTGPVSLTVAQWVRVTQGVTSYFMPLFA